MGRSFGSPQELERRRRLAVQRVEEGYKQDEVARMFDVTPHSVSQWVCAYRKGGDAALKARPASGRNPRMTPEQEQQVLDWISQSPTDFGFANEQWTARRVTKLIRDRFGIDFNPRYVNAWLAKRKVTPQNPERV